MRPTPHWYRLDLDEIGARGALEVQAGLERGWDADYGLGWELRQEWAAMTPGAEKELFYAKAQLLLLEERCGMIPGGPQMERPRVPAKDAARRALMDAEEEERGQIEGQAQLQLLAKAQLQLLGIVLGELAASNKVCKEEP